MQLHRQSPITSLQTSVHSVDQAQGCHTKRTCLTAYQRHLKTEGEVQGHSKQNDFGAVYTQQLPPSANCHCSISETGGMQMADNDRTNLHSAA